MNSILKSFKVATTAGRFVRYLALARSLAIALSLAAAAFGLIKTVMELQKEQGIRLSKQ